jgi:hypothetical protein
MDYQNVFQFTEQEKKTLFSVLDEINYDPTGSDIFFSPCPNQYTPSAKSGNISEHLSRDKFSPSYDDMNTPLRWVQRVFVSANLWNHRNLNQIEERIFSI